MIISDLKHWKLDAEFNNVDSKELAESGILRRPWLRIVAIRIDENSGETRSKCISISPDAQDSLVAMIQSQRQSEAIVIKEQS